MNSHLLLSTAGARAFALQSWQWRRYLFTSILRPDSASKPAIEASMEPKSQVANTTTQSTDATADSSPGPKMLPGPIGIPQSPRSGELPRLPSPEDGPDRAKRIQLLKASMKKSFFGDWDKLRHYEGKTFRAPPRLFKATYSLFFPDFGGLTLFESGPNFRHTTPLLTGKVSVVSIFNGTWAEMQVKSFVSPTANPELHETLSRAGDISQLVYINYEEGRARFKLARFFHRFVRQKVPEQDWNKHLLVKRGLTDYIREAMAISNSKAGYVYLVDNHCRIRWAASGQSQPDERESLAKGLAKLVENIRTNFDEPPLAYGPDPHSDPEQATPEQLPPAKKTV